MHIVTEMYAELHDFYDEISPQMGEHAYGGRILYSLPTRKARVMFIGAQPGGTVRTLDTTWPDSNDYADGARFLGETLRRLVDREVLRRHTVGTNVNFIRAPNGTYYRKNISKELRDRIASFCLPHVHCLIRELDPQAVVCIGFESFELLSLENKRIDEMRQNNKDVLIKKGEIANRPVVAFPHLTGSRISSIDMDTIGKRLRALLEYRL